MRLLVLPAQRGRIVDGQHSDLLHLRNTLPLLVHRLSRTSPAAMRPRMTRSAVIWLIPRHPLGSGIGKHRRRRY